MNAKKNSLDRGRIWKAVQETLECRPRSLSEMIYVILGRLQETPREEVLNEIAQAYHLLITEKVVVWQKTSKR